MATVLDYGEPELDSNQVNQDADVEMDMDLNPQTTIAEIYNEDIDGPDGDRRTKFYPLPQDADVEQNDREREHELQVEEELEERIIGKESE